MKYSFILYTGTDFLLDHPVGEHWAVTINGPFVYGGTNCARGWNFADIFFSDSVKIMRFYDFARTSVS